MVAPVVKCYQSNDSTEFNDSNPINLGVVDAGTSGNEIEVHIWNNKGGSSDVSKMENVRVTTVTGNGYNSGDTIPNGKDAVEDKYVGIKSDTNGDSDFTQIGGTTTKALADIRGDLLLSPGKPSGVVSHASGARVRPGSYFAKVSALDETGETLCGTESDAVTVSPMVSQATEDTDSETLDTTTNTRIAQKFTSDGTYVNGMMLLMKSAGTLVGTLRIETDNADSPSGTLANANLEKTGVTLTAGANTFAWFDLEGIITTATTYWLVFIPTAGTGILRGTTTGTADRVKIYTGGAWVNSSLIENLVFKIIDDNKINWSWTDSTNALSYKLFRALSSGSYGASSLVASGIPYGGTYSDIIENTISGQPLGSSGCVRGHKHVIKSKLTLPTDATSGAVDMHLRVLYQYQ